jgi:5-methyltetrahydropteroyltriglutamate--homocysteine methyltransferase
MALLTTTVGAYPRPVAVFFPNRGRADRTGQNGPTARYSQTDAVQATEAEKLLNRAIRQVVVEQVELGIEVPTTGEVPRDKAFHFIFQQLGGIDLERLSEKVSRLGPAAQTVPAVTGPITFGDHFLLNEWRVAQSATKRPVKITLPGPFSLADRLADETYGDEKRLMAALAEALNREIRDLAEAGCGWIQIDEPLFALEPEQAIAFGIDHLEHCFHRAPAAVMRVVHLCSGYPTEVDNEDYPRAEAEAYFQLAEPLELSSLQAVSIEDAHRPNDLSLLEQFLTTRVILGLIATARSQVEEVELMADRLKTALDHIEAQRLIVAPDCGLHLLDRRVAVAKLRNMVLAAKAVG